MPILPNNTWDAEGKGCMHIGRVILSGIMSWTKVGTSYSNSVKLGAEDTFRAAVTMGLVFLNGTLTKNGVSELPPSLPKDISFSEEKMERKGGVWLNGRGCCLQKSV